MVHRLYKVDLISLGCKHEEQIKLILKRYAYIFQKRSLLSSFLKEALFFSFFFNTKNSLRITLSHCFT